VTARDKARSPTLDERRLATIEARIVFRTRRRANTRCRANTRYCIQDLTKLSLPIQRRRHCTTTSAMRNDMKGSIRSRRTFSKADLKSKGFVYEYSDGLQKFLFEVRFINEEEAIVEKGVLVQPKYFDIEIFNIGRYDLSIQETKPIKYVANVKSDMTEYFSENIVPPAQGLPGKIVFK
jgi:hypothetical protein